MTPFYTTNPFGPSAGRDSRCMSGCMFVSLSCRSEITMKGGVWRSDLFLNNLDCLRGCANLCLEEIRPVEVPLRQMWSKKLRSFSPYFTWLAVWATVIPRRDDEGTPVLHICFSSMSNNKLVFNKQQSSLPTCRAGTFNARSLQSTIKKQLNSLFVILKITT